MGFVAQPIFQNVHNRLAMGMGLFYLYTALGSVSGGTLWTSANKNVLWQPCKQSSASRDPEVDAVETAV